MRELVILDEAIDDLKEIARYIAKRERNRERGASFTKRLRDKCSEMAATEAVLGRPRPQFGYDLRSITFLNYLIFFRYVGERLEVAAFVHGARDLATAFAEREQRDS